MQVLSAWMGVCVRPPRKLPTQANLRRKQDLRRELLHQLFVVDARIEEYLQQHYRYGCALAPFSAASNGSRPPAQACHPPFRRKSHRAAWGCLALQGSEA
jgi:hypothetical protein